MSRQTAARVHHVWRKLAGAKWEDAWEERLAGFSDRLAITGLPGAKTIRLEVFQLNKADAGRLRRAFGGTVAVQKQWKPVPGAKPRPPILVRGRLAVIAGERERGAVKRGVPALLIPAGMAFGTGEHATTVTCLRLLADIADELRAQRWEMLDLGTGSGILALAARVLGAAKCEGADFDPHAVRTAKANVLANRITRVSMRKLDVRAWTPARKWTVVAANLFSGLLIEVAPKLAAAVAAGDGRLILSGILRTQEAGVVAALQKAGVRIGKTVRRGKWIAMLATLRGKTVAARRRAAM